MMKSGINKNNLDTSKSPRHDFYDYATGGWRKAHPLTDEYSRFGMFDLLRENNREQLKSLILGLASTPESKIPGTIAQKVSDIYEQGMDIDRLNSDVNAPLMPYLTKFKSFTDNEFWQKIAWLHSGLATGVIFASGVSPHPGNSDLNIMHIGETGLGLGDRDYYLEKNDENKRILDAYEIYVKRLMSLIGYSDSEAERIWKNVIDFETQIAKIKMTREDRRNPQLRYNIVTRGQLHERWPDIDWETYFKSLGVKDFDSLNVLSVGFFDGLNKMMPNLPSQQLDDYLLFNIVAESTGVLSDDFYDASFDLYDRVMSGKKEKQPRWKRAMAIPGSMLGEAVGKLYVEKYFPEANKKYMLDLVENLRKALAKHISNLQWMEDTTKSKALEKLEAMSVKIGYPDKWKDYAEIDINPNQSYLDNVLKAAQWYVNDNYAKLGTEVDKSEWHMTPQTVNAYYSPLQNEICFPAGILQPPYFNPEADEAINYGAIGVVIGHEMTHGFDDQGRQFDKNGSINDWWTKEDAERFNKLTQKLVTQFNSVEVAPGLKANGQFTLGENIADQGGLRIALTAYLDSSTNKEECNDGFTNLQRFYLSYSSLWASNIRDEEILVRTKTDPHSLERNRVNVTLKNLAPFIEAFNIKEDDKMYLEPESRVIIW